jgi:hypothetical protein
MLKELEIMQLWSVGKRWTGGSELRRVWESTPKCVVGVGHAFWPLFLHISAHICGRGVSVSSTQQSSSTILSTMNMTNWHSVATAVDDTTAVLDSCSLKYRRRAYFTAYVKEEKKELKTKARTFASSLL